MANNPRNNANKKLKHHRNQVPTTLMNFKQVQSVLDRNRMLIQQVNDNHQSKNPDNMVKNVALIQELNGNISKVVSLYSDMSSNFSTSFHNNGHHKEG
ncbi:hypothetical protein V6Z11_D10G292500 [Gossypium hirsutum]